MQVLNLRSPNCFQKYRDQNNAASRLNRGRHRLWKTDCNVESPWCLEKLKETKGSRESSAKVQKYLDGLLKAYFGIYKKDTPFRVNRSTHYFFYHCSSVGNPWIIKFIIFRNSMKDSFSCKNTSFSWNIFISSDKRGIPQENPGSETKQSQNSSVYKNESTKHFAVFLWFSTNICRILRKNIQSFLDIFFSPLKNGQR